MVRSPHKLRSRGKTVADKRRSLSVDCDPTADNDNDMVLTKKDIEECVNKHLSGDVFDNLAAKLTDRLKVVVEEAVAAALKTAQEEIGKLKNEVSVLKTKVADLETKVVLKTDDLEQYQRRTNLRVFGIPEKEGEDTDKLLVELFRDKMKVPIPLECIDRSHRVGRQPEPGPDGKVRPRPIIVRFTSYRDRRRVFEVKKVLKNTGITVREDLTAYRLQVFKAAADKYGVRNTWTVDGRVKWITGDGNNKTVHTTVRLSDV